MPGTEKSSWDKADVILRPVGGLLTALAVLWLTQKFNEQQTFIASHRHYTELMMNREEADTGLRKDMFNSAIRTFVGSEGKEVPLNKQVLNLELLAYNFHESIDLGPIFKDVYERVRNLKEGDEGFENKGSYRDRVERVAKEVIDMEIPGLEVEGKLDGNFYFEDLKPEGFTVIEGSLPKPAEVSSKEDDSLAPRRDFKVTVLRVNHEMREVRVALDVRTPRQNKFNKSDKKEADYVTTVFWIGFSDFPMIDNTRLSDGYRCGIVLRSLDESGGRMTLVYFPTSRAALKDKPYYDEFMDELLRTQKHSEKHVD